MMAEGLSLSGFAIPATLTLIAPWEAMQWLNMCVVGLRESFSVDTTNSTLILTRIFLETRH